MALLAIGANPCPRPQGSQIEPGKVCIGRESTGIKINPITRLVGVPLALERNGKLDLLIDVVGGAGQLARRR